jgi:hypothetical protein
MLIVDNRSGKVSRINAKLIPIGTVFNGSIGDYKNYTIFLRTYSCIVSLNDPKGTWDRLETLEIYNYQPLKVRLVIEGNIPFPNINDKVVSSSFDENDTGG